LGKGGGTGSPSGRGCVGRHSTSFSPITDWSRILHSASLRKSWKPGSSIFRITAARRSSVTSSWSIAPTLAPAIITSWPGIANAALLKIARIL
jgi:hypothetical protein